MDFIEKWKFKLLGRGVQTFRIEEADEDGKVVTLRDIGKNKLRGNSLVETWNSEGAELNKTTGLVTYIDANGLLQPAYITYKGQTVDLLNTKHTFAPEVKDVYINLKNLSPVIGKMATFDDLVDALDLGKSMKNYILGALFSAPVWWLIFKSFGVIFS